MAKQMAIMRGVGYGCRDTNRPVLFFTAKLSEFEASLQIVYQPQADEVLRKSGVYDVKDLEGKACWVESDGNMVKFIEVAKV